MPDRIRFTLIEDDQDVRPYDFDTQMVQIGADPDRGDNLLIPLPPRLRHVRAKIHRQADYVEMEVVAGPVWVQGSRLEENDVVELNVGDLLVFGTRKSRGVRLRFEYATEAAIVIDDVADWTASAAPKKKRGSAAEEDAFAFEEEVDPTEGMNAFQKARFWYRKQYKKFTAWRKKGARLKYWTSLIGILWSKFGKGVAMVGGVAVLGIGWFGDSKDRKEAEEAEEVAVTDESSAVRAEREAFLAQTEIQRQMRECNCPGAPGVDQVEMDGAEALLTAFSADETFAPQRRIPMPGGESQSLANLVGSYIVTAGRSKTTIRTTRDRICSSLDGRRMQTVDTERQNLGLDPVYSYLPFVESNWCGFAVDAHGRRGVMQLTPAAARRAFELLEGSTPDIPEFDEEEHLEWLAEKGARYGGPYGLLAKCPQGARDEYVQKFYEGRRDPDHPDRLDPDDPRTDWQASMKAGLLLIQEIDKGYRKRGFRPVDASLLTLASYDVGHNMVESWIKAAAAGYKIEDRAALTYVHVYGGAVAVAAKEKKPEDARRVLDAAKAPAKAMAYYLYAQTNPEMLGCED